MSTKDCNGNPLNDGDSVQVIKDLKVKGSSITLKRGTKFKNLHLTGNTEEVECRQGKPFLCSKHAFEKDIKTNSFS